jgi:hypothetical protein
LFIGISPLLAVSVPVPVKLQCEYLTNPLGIDAVHPRLMWQMSDLSQGVCQTAYQVVVGIDSVEVRNGLGSVPILIIFTVTLRIVHIEKKMVGREMPTLPLKRPCMALTV